MYSNKQGISSSSYALGLTILTSKHKKHLALLTEAFPNIFWSQFKIKKFDDGLVLDAMKKALTETTKVIVQELSLAWIRKLIKADVEGFS